MSMMRVSVLLSDSINVRPTISVYRANTPSDSGDQLTYTQPHAQDGIQGSDTGLRSSNKGTAPGWEK